MSRAGRRVPRRAMRCRTLGLPSQHDKEDTMANPALSPKRFEQIEKEDEAGCFGPPLCCEKRGVCPPPHPIQARPKPADARSAPVTTASVKPTDVGQG